MKKLIDQYSKYPLIANAMRIMIHARRHPTEAALLNPEDAKILEKARMELRPVAEKLAASIQGEAF